jgi:SAM-dependent methyltransferase
MQHTMAEFCPLFDDIVVVPTKPLEPVIVVLHDGRSITIRQGDSVDDTGGVVQLAALALIKQLTTDALTSRAHEATIVDIGCGVGAVAVALALLFKKLVIATDGDSSTLKVAREKAVGNGVEVVDTSGTADENRAQVSLLQARWCDLAARLSASASTSKPLMIVASDVVYDDTSLYAFAFVLNDLFATFGSKHSVACVCLKRRGDGALVDKFVSYLEHTLKFCVSTKIVDVENSIVCIDIHKQRVPTSAY